VLRKVIWHLYLEILARVKDFLRLSHLYYRRTYYTGPSPKLPGLTWYVSAFICRIIHWSSGLTIALRLVIAIEKRLKANILRTRPGC
jgi:hypothetical protein